MEIDFKIVNREDEVMSELKNGVLEGGVHTVLFDTANLNDGEYYYQIITPVQKTSKKFFIVNHR